MSHRVNTVMERMQPADRDAVVYGALAETQRQELTPRYDPMLADRQGSNAPIGWKSPGRTKVNWSTFSTYVEVDVDQFGHGANDGARMRTNQPAIVKKACRYPACLQGTVFPSGGIGCFFKIRAM